MEQSTNPLGIGITGLNFPPREAIESFARRVDESGVFDCVYVSDQAVLTVPLSIWTEDLVGPAAAFNVDTWMDPYVSALVHGLVMERTGVAIACTDALRRPPSVTAQALLSLDHMVGGGTFAVLAAGEMKQFSPYGLTRNRPIGHLEDAVRFCKMLMSTSDPVSAEGNIRNLDRATLALPQVGSAPPGVWVAGGSPRSLEIAGKYADGWLTWGPGCVTAEEFGEMRDIVRGHAADAGRDPNEVRCGFMPVYALVGDEREREALCEHPIMKWNTLVTGPDAKSWRKHGFEHPLGADWGYARDLCPQWWGRDECLEVIDQVPPESVAAFMKIGSVQAIEEFIQSYIHAGADYIMAAPFPCGALEGDTGRAGETRSEVEERELWAMFGGLKEKDAARRGMALVP